MATVLDDRKTIPPPALASFPVREADQDRNVLLFGVLSALFYLASPVLMVGRLQAALCSALGASDTVANLPGSAYLVMAVSPLVVACLFPQVSLLKRVLVICYLLLGVMGGLVALALLLPLPNSVKIGVVILQGLVTGAALTTATMFLFEVLGQGAEESKRGRALSLGYGRGPILGFLAALGLQLLLDGRSFGLTIPAVPAPWNLAIPFATSVPIMGLCAWLATRFVIEPVHQEPLRRPFFESLFGGLGDFLKDRVLVRVMVIGVVAYCGFAIGQNMTLYTKEVLGVPPEQLVGNQLAIRFGFKMVAGLFLGALLARTNPRATMLVGALFAFSGIVWAMTATGNLFLLSFGLLGAGELFGIYLNNYILSCSSRTQTRRNMGFASLMMVASAPSGAFFGSVSENLGTIYSRGTGFRLSFAIAAACMGLVILLVCFLPARPKPRAESE